MTSKRLDKEKTAGANAVLRLRVEQRWRIAVLDAALHVGAEIARDERHKATSRR